MSRLGRVWGNHMGCGHGPVQDGRLHTLRPHMQPYFDVRFKSSLHCPVAARPFHRAVRAARTLCYIPYPSVEPSGSPLPTQYMRDSSHFRRLNKTVMSEQTPSPLTLKLDHTLITHMPVRGTQMPP